MNQQAMPSGPSLRTSPVLGWKTSTPWIWTWIRPVCGSSSAAGPISMSGSPKIHEEVALAGVGEVVGHVEVGVHPGLEHREGTELVELRRVSLEVEGARDENVEAGLGRLARGSHEVLSADGAELGTDHDRGSALGAVFTLRVAAFGADPFAGPRLDG